jgi:hypothetical protein
MPCIFLILVISQGANRKPPRINMDIYQISIIVSIAKVGLYFDTFSESYLFSLMMGQKIIKHRA